MKLIRSTYATIFTSRGTIHLDAIVPERYVLEQDEQIQSVMIPKFSFLFADGGTIRLNSSKTLHTYIPDITLTITESIKYISELKAYVLKHLSKVYKPTCTKQCF